MVWAWVCVWAVVTCLARPAHGQLGVVGVGEEVTRGRDMPFIINQEGKVSKGGSEGELKKNSVTVTEAVTEEKEEGEWRWRPVLDTYQGCYYWQTFNGTLMYVNLTQVMEINHLDNEEEACLHMCRVKEPMSLYTSVSASFSSSSVGGCGCLDLLEDEDKVEDEKCLEEAAEEEYYRVFCGPANVKCLSQGVTVTASPLLLLLLPLLTLLHSRPSRN